MLIKDLFKTVRPVISFEIFPPRNDSPIETIYRTLDGLKDLQPDFISVTYGAGGSNTCKTGEIAAIVKHRYGIEALAHLTCITAQSADIKRAVEQLTAYGIENVLALRGDRPVDPNCPLSSDYCYARDLIRDLQQHAHFCIGAACYPEGHIECIDPALDLIYLKEKVDAGVDFLITQLFFDNELFYAFREKMVAKNINVPVTAGIMPVLNKKQIEHILKLCKVHLPRKFTRIMERYEHNAEALKEAGIAYATEQIIDLLSSGVEGIHLYTMNRPEVAHKIVNNIANIRNVVKGQANN